MESYAGFTYHGAIEFSVDNVPVRVVISLGNIEDFDPLYRPSAIVNSANESLIQGSGVDRAISIAAGREMEEERYRLRRCEPGSAVVTTAGKLRVEHCIHAVGPRLSGNFLSAREMIILHDAYKSALAHAEQRQCATVAFPFICGGVFGPINPDESVTTNLLAISLHGIVSGLYPQLKEVHFVMFKQAQLEALLEVVRQSFGQNNPYGLHEFIARNRGSEVVLTNTGRPGTHPALMDHNSRRRLDENPAYPR
eukprot:c8325_g1_i2.p1 GENE.c8325_g1_i2~~c8325_g1_i2.p1  ORF type:complete len:268 (+),score=50.16 c8325_g1_i2:51-806(+)